MNLPPPDQQYSQTNEAETRRLLQEADQNNVKRDENFQLNADQYIIIPDEDTGDLYRLKIASGVLSIEPT
jgi:hypothetical protein